MPDYLYFYIGYMFGVVTISILVIFIINNMKTTKKWGVKWF